MYPDFLSSSLVAAAVIAIIGATVAIIAAAAGTTVSASVNAFAVSLDSDPSIINANRTRVPGVSWAVRADNDTLMHVPVPRWTGKGDPCTESEDFIPSVASRGLVKSMGGQLRLLGSVEVARRRMALRS